MSLATYNAYPDVDNLMVEIDKYDLHEHVVELEAYGMTVVPPEKMQSKDGFVDRLRTAIIRTCEKRNGIEIGDEPGGLGAGAVAARPKRRFFRPDVDHQGRRRSWTRPAQRLAWNSARCRPDRPHVQCVLVVHGLR